MFLTEIILKIFAIVVDILTLVIDIIKELHK